MDFINPGESVQIFEELLANFEMTECDFPNNNSFSVFVCLFQICIVVSVPAVVVIIVVVFCLLVGKDLPINNLLCFFLIRLFSNILFLLLYCFSDQEPHPSFLFCFAFFFK